MPWRRIVALALLVYLAVDYSDPSIDGVFAFKAGRMFLDGALDGRAQPHTARAALPTLAPVLDAPADRLRPEPPPVVRPRVRRSPGPRGHARILPPLSSDDRSVDH